MSSLTAPSPSSSEIVVKESNDYSKWLGCRYEHYDDCSTTSFASESFAATETVFSELSEYLVQVSRLLSDEDVDNVEDEMDYENEDCQHNDDDNVDDESLSSYDYDNIPHEIEFTAPQSNMNDIDNDEYHLLLEMLRSRERTDIKGLSQASALESVVLQQQANSSNNNKTLSPGERFVSLLFGHTSTNKENTCNVGEKHDVLDLNEMNRLHKMKLLTPKGQ